MSVYVLVYGAWGGGWQWRQTANLLRARGHEVYTPTLTGLGDRAHVPLDPALLTLSAHVDDVVQLLYFEDLVDVIIVGWSYGASVVDGVADRVPERLRLVVNLDGGLAEEGRSSIDDDDEVSLRTGCDAPPVANDLSAAITDPDLRSFIADRLRPHPVASFMEPYPDRGRRRDTVPHVFIRCVDPNDLSAQEDEGVTALRSNRGWQVTELAVNHLGLLYAPEVVADAFHALS